MCEADYTRILAFLHYSYKGYTFTEKSPLKSPLEAIFFDIFFVHTDNALLSWLGRAPADTESCISAYVGFLNSQRFFLSFLYLNIPF